MTGTPWFLARSTAHATLPDDSAGIPSLANDPDLYIDDDQDCLVAFSHGCHDLRLLFTASFAIPIGMIWTFKQPLRRVCHGRVNITDQAKV
jgi:hypothetical protein